MSGNSQAISTPADAHCDDGALHKLNTTSHAQYSTRALTEWLCSRRDRRLRQRATPTNAPTLPNGNSKRHKRVSWGPRRTKCSKSIAPLVRTSTSRSTRPLVAKDRALNPPGAEPNKRKGPSGNPCVPHEPVMRAALVPAVPGGARYETPGTSASGRQRAGGMWKGSRHCSAVSTYARTSRLHWRSEATSAGAKRGAVSARTCAVRSGLDLSLV